MIRLIDTLNIITYLYGNRFILFLIDPDKETFEISRKFDECFRTLIESNVTFTRMLVNKCINELRGEDKNFT